MNPQSQLAEQDCSGMKSKYFLTLVRMQAGAGLVARKLNVQGNIEHNSKAKDWQSKTRTKNLKPKTKDVVNGPRRYSTLKPCP